MSNLADLSYAAPPEPETHRDRKARLTRRAIHVAAVRQVLSSGLEQATVAQIAEEAGVSKRTFFNYFESKEDAIVGLTEHSLDEEQVAEFLDSPDDSGTALAADTARLLHAAYLLTFNDDEVARDRRRIFAQHPELLRRQMEKNEHVSRQVTAVVVERMRRHGLHAHGTADLEDVAEMLVMVCAAPLRITGRRIAQHAHDPAADPYTSELFDSSVKLFTDVLKGPAT